MRLYIADDEKLTKFDLPKEVEGSFLVTYKPTNSNKEYTISIESNNGVWYIRSNGLINVLQNQVEVMEVPLSDYSYHQLRIVGDRNLLNLYCVPSVEKNISDISVFNQEKIVIGSNPGSNIFYQNAMIEPNHATVSLQNGKYFISASATGVYLNDQRIAQAYLNVGDVLFIYGLKIIFMGNFIRINNPSGNVLTNGLSGYNDINLIDNNDYDKTSLEDFEIELFKEDDYFFHTPRIKNFITTQKVIINDPPTPEKDNSLPFLLSMGSSLTMASSSLISSYTVIYSLSNGTTQLATAIPSLLMCFMMLIGSVLMPRLIQNYNKNKLKNVKN